MLAAVAGPAAVIGHGDGPGLPLPADMPEKWCGLVGAMLALAEDLARSGRQRAGIRCVRSGHHARLRAPELRHAGGTPPAVEAQRTHLRRARPHLPHGLFRLPGRPCRAARTFAAGLATHRASPGRPGMGAPPRLRQSVRAGKGQRRGGCAAGGNAGRQGARRPARTRSGRRRGDRPRLQLWRGVAARGVPARLRGAGDAVSG